MTDTKELPLHIRQAADLKKKCKRFFTIYELHKMKRVMEQLRTENEILRLCNCSTVSISEKVDDVKYLQRKFSPHSLSKALNLSHATFYRVGLEQKMGT